MAASTTLLAGSRTGRRGGVLPWALLVAGSVASLAANGLTRMALPVFGHGDDRGHRAGE